MKLKIPGVINIASSPLFRTGDNSNNGYMMKEGRKDETFLMQTNYVDDDYLATYGMTVMLGEGILINHILPISRHAW